MKTGACILTLVVLVLSSLPQSARAEEATQTKPNVSNRDGQHDFDFNFGVWKTHIKRVLEPLSGSNKSIELNGLVTTHKIWDGRAQWEEIEADGPNGHWQGMTLFLYNIIFPPEPAAKSPPGEEEADPEGIPFLRAAFWFGIFIVLMASTLKHLHH